MATPSSDKEEAALNNYGAGLRFTPNTPLTPMTAAAAAGKVVPAPSPLFPGAPRRGLTLADIRRRNLEEQNAARDEGHLRRYRMLNYSSEDSALQRLGERRLHTFYCSCCGANALVAEVDFEEMPRRGTDESYVLQTQEVFNKVYAVPSKRVILRRPTGLEVQYQLKCRDCGVAIGYRSSEVAEEAPFLYLFSDALTKEQSMAFAWQGQ